MNPPVRKPLTNPELSRPSALDSSPRLSDRIWLDKNESLDPELNQVYGEILAGLDPLTVSIYPEAGALYRKLAEWIGVDPHALILTPGSDGAIRLTFEAFVNEGDTVMHTFPTFAMYPVYCQIFGARPVRIVYEATPTGPKLDVQHLRRSIREYRPKLVCLPNPDSPTGTVIEPDLWPAILDECAAVNAVALIDEAYHPFYDWTAVPLLETYPNLVIARTFAKAWGAAGLRIGYAVSTTTLAEFLHKIKPMYEVSTIAVEVMSQMLDRTDAMVASVKRIKDSKNRFTTLMNAMGYGTLKTHGNFVHVRFGSDAQTIHEALGGRVYYRQSFDQSALSGYTRFSVAPSATMDQVAQLISAAAGKNK